MKNKKSDKTKIVVDEMAVTASVSEAEIDLIEVFVSDLVEMLVRAAG